ncbi:MAG: hypothetical protein JST93_31835 [Acidobacteria bacterium]|nr:hypothetical protein [Acidobacteriota bacterium]
MSVLLVCLGLEAAPADHVVPLQEMERRIARETAGRRVNLGKVESFLAMDQVEEVLRTSKLDSQAIRAAAAMLSDEELSKLAQRADGVKADIQGGALSNTELTYVVIALVTALVVVIIFVA